MLSKILQTEHEKELNELKNEYEKKLNEQKERIIALREENDDLKQKLNSYSVKDESISRALVLAVEKAKELENSSKNLYELEIQRIRILYSRWEKMLEAIVEKYPNIKTISEVKNLMAEFDNSIKSTIQTSFVAHPEEDKTYVKQLLNKMNGVTSKTAVLNQSALKQTEEVQQKNKPTEIKNISEEINHQSILKPVSNMELDKNDKYENLVDKFLNSNDDSEIKSAYAKKIAPILNQRIEEKIENYIKSNNDRFDLSEAIADITFLSATDNSSHILSYEHSSRLSL